ncbi:MAG TPA: alpha/beta hydrolase [Candidatus Acidoferrales bacterium]|nr:alpha/beta hydrolase [Candidatus Acidoferrales bacterium]
MPNNSELGRRAFLGVSAAVLANSLPAFASPARPADNEVKIDKNVVFGKGGDTELRCDLYRPAAGTEKRMALVHLHGGGFARGSKDTMAGKVTPITSRGYVSVVIDYRLTGVAKWPAQIEDVKTAIRWTRSNAASLGIDPQRIATVGYSAGGHLSVFAAGAPDTQLAACAAFYPAVELSKETAETLLPNVTDEAVHEASPITYIKAGFPPTVIFHGLADVTVRPESSEHLLQVLRSANVPSELHTFAGVPHEFDSHPEFADACANLTDFFLEREVLHPRTYPPFRPGAPAEPRRSA